MINKFQDLDRIKKFTIYLILIPIVAIIIFQIPVFQQNNAYAQTIDCSSSLVTRVDGSYNGPVVLDAYFTDASSSAGTTEKPLKLEVGPGEGPTTLAVVLVNRSQQTGYAVQGFLQLPKGFKPGGISAEPEARAMFNPIKGSGFNTPALASYFATVTPGQTFTLYFDIIVLDEAKVGTYNASLIGRYTTAENQRGCNSALLNVPFVLPGKVILDIVSTNQQLAPKSENTVNFSIVNKGSSPATGVVATIIGLGDRNTGGSSGGNNNSVVLQSSSTQLVNLGSSSFNIGMIPANGKTTISTVIFPSGSAGSTVQNVDIQLTYGNAYGYRQSQILSTGLVISPTPTDTSLIITSADNKTPFLITAGKSEDVDLSIFNSGKVTLTDVIITLSTDSDSLKIVGNPKFVIPILEAGSSKQIKSQVFAGTNLINTPVSFSISEDYITEGERKIETAAIGGFVAGNVKLELYDLQVVQQANQFTIVGNILNQGSTTGKFSNIELISFTPKVVPPRINSEQDNDQFQDTMRTNSEEANAQFPQGEGGRIGESKILTSAPQYLGDLPDDSTIPFSIPLSKNQIVPGIYPASFKISYYDDLKNQQQVIIDGQVAFEPQQNNLVNSSGFNQRSNTGIPIFIYPVIVAVGAGISFIVVRKIKKSKFKNSYNNDDIEAILDSTASNSD